MLFGCYSSLVLAANSQGCAAVLHCFSSIFDLSKHTRPKKGEVTVTDLEDSPIG